MFNFGQQVLALKSSYILVKHKVHAAVIEPLELFFIHSHARQAR